MLQGPPWLYAFILAVIGGGALGLGSYLLGGFCCALAILLMAAWHFRDPGEDDHTGRLR